MEVGTIKWHYVTLITSLQFECQTIRMIPLALLCVLT